jgi:hypothetical protein
VLSDQKARIVLTRYDFFFGLAPPYHHFREPIVATVVAAEIKGLVIHHLINEAIDLLDLARVENGGIPQVCSQVLAERAMAFAPVYIAIPICFIRKPADGANQFSLHGRGLALRRHKLIPELLKIGFPFITFHRRIFRTHGVQTR